MMFSIVCLLISMKDFDAYVSLPFIDCQILTCVSSIENGFIFDRIIIVFSSSLVKKAHHSLPYDIVF